MAERCNLKLFCESKECICVEPKFYYIILFWDAIAAGPVGILCLCNSLPPGELG